VIDDHLIDDHSINNHLITKMGVNLIWWWGKRRKYSRDNELNIDLRWFR
jgi:hypothetical protein